MKRLIYRSATFSLLSSLVCASNRRGTEHGELQRHHRHPANCTIAANNRHSAPRAC